MRRAPSLRSAGWSVQYDDHPLERPDVILCRTGAETDYFTLAVLRHFERRGARLINGPEAIGLVGDKLHTMQQLVRAGLPILKPSRLGSGLNQHQNVMAAARKTPAM